MLSTTPSTHSSRTFYLCAAFTGILTRFALFRRGHFQRALEESVQMHNSQWPVAWGGKNPLHGGGNFNTMSPEQRVCYLFMTVTDVLY